MTNILYKYRSLANFRNFVDIILKNRLYAAKYKDLNDPMEGQYYYYSGELNKDIRNKLFQEKGELRICSLSQANDNLLMWSHYADGHRGVVIGLEIDDSNYQVKPVQYNGLAFINDRNFSDKTAIEILSHKLEVWNYEKEVRVFVRDKHYIEANIVEIYTGIGMSPQDYSFVNLLINRINPNIRIAKAESIIDQ